MTPDDLPTPVSATCTKADGQYQVVLTYASLAAAQRAHWMVTNQTRGTVLTGPWVKRPNPDQPLGAA